MKIAFLEKINLPRLSQGLILVIFVTVFSLMGVGYVYAGQAASTPPNGYFEIVTYQGSVAPGNEIGGVQVIISPGGSGVECEYDGIGTTDTNGGPNHGHKKMTCPASSSGGSREYTVEDFSRSGYTISSSGPHLPGSKIHIIGTGKTTTVSLVLNGTPPSPATAPTSTAPPTTAIKPPESAPIGTLEIVTLEEPGASGNEIGNVQVAIDQGGSNVWCDKRSATTDNLGKGTNGNYGKVHLNCPAAKDGGPRTYRLTSASKANYTISPLSQVQIGQTFKVSEGNNSLVIVMKKTPGTTITPLPAPIEKPPTKKPNSAPNKKDTSSNENKAPTTNKPVTPSTNCNALSNLRLSDCRENQEKKNESTSPNNVLVIYSAQGKYKYVGIGTESNSIQGKNGRCRVLQNTSTAAWQTLPSPNTGRYTTFKLPTQKSDGSYPPLQLECEPTAALEVRYRDPNGKYVLMGPGTKYESIKSYTNTCVYVHEWGISRKIARTSTLSCDAGGEDDKPKVRDSSIYVDNAQISGGKIILTGTLTGSTWDISSDCKGNENIRVQINSTSGKDYSVSYSTPITWIDNDCRFNGNWTNNNLVKGKKYSIQIKFPGNESLPPYKHDLIYRTAQ